MGLGLRVLGLGIRVQGWRGGGSGSQRIFYKDGAILHSTRILYRSRTKGLQMRMQCF